FFFFFQAEDGIRDFHVTGVQTCALPILAEGLEHGDFSYITVFDVVNNEQVASCKTHMPVHYLSEVVEWLAYEYYQALIIIERNRSEERRVGKEWRERRVMRRVRKRKIVE